MSGAARDRRRIAIGAAAIAIVAFAAILAAPLTPAVAQESAPSEPDPATPEDDPLPSVARGLFLEKVAGDLDAAAAVYEALAARAGHATPERGDALLRLASCLHKLGRTAAAREAIGEIRRETLPETPLHRRADALRRRIIDEEAAAAAIPPRPEDGGGETGDAAPGAARPRAAELGPLAGGPFAAAIPSAGSEGAAPPSAATPGAGDATEPASAADLAGGAAPSADGPTAGMLVPRELGVVLGVWRETDRLLLDFAGRSGLREGDLVAIYRGRALVAVAEILESHLDIVGAQLVLERRPVRRGDVVAVGPHPPSPAAGSRLLEPFPDEDEVRRRLATLEGDVEGAPPAGAAPGDPIDADEVARAIEELYRERRRTLQVEVMAIGSGDPPLDGLELPWRLTENLDGEQEGASPGQLVIAVLGPVEEGLVDARIATSPTLTVEGHSRAEISNGRRGQLEIGTYDAYQARGPKDEPTRRDDAERPAGVGGPGVPRMGRVFVGVRVTVRPILTDEDERVRCELRLETVTAGTARKFPSAERVLVVPDVAVTRARCRAGFELPSRVVIGGLSNPFSTRAQTPDLFLIVRVSLREKD